MSRRAELTAAYLATTYRVLLPERPLDLRLEVRHAGLQSWLVSVGGGCFAIITADNPASCLRSDKENRQDGERLGAALASMGRLLVPTLHLADDGAWPVEKGFYVNGLSLSGARAFARDYGQNAFVWGGADGVPHLVWTDDKEKDETPDWSL